MSPLLKSLIKYLGIFLAIFIVLFFFFSTPSGKKAVNDFYCGTHEGVYQKLLPKLKLRFNPKGEGITDWNTFNFEFGSIAEEKRIIADARKRGLKTVDIPLETAVFHLDIFFTPFIVFLSALFLATPLPFKKRVIALVWGIVLFLLYQFIRVFVKLLVAVNHEKIGSYEYEGSAEKMLTTSAEIMQAGFTAMMVVFIWALVVFNKKNTNYIKNKLGIMS